MPTYEYKCNACGHRFERFHGMSARPAKRCPKCGRSARRLISAGAGVLTTGSGSSCAFRSTGKTCCGRDQRCSGPSCEERRE